jgi:hypothetical protein
MTGTVPLWWEPYAGLFPCWYAWEGVNGLLYARRARSSPPKVARGVTPAELADDVRRQLTELQMAARGRGSRPQPTGLTPNCRDRRGLDEP